jgi:hypothetical protein
MKFRAKTTSGSVASTMGAGAMILLNQTALHHVSREASIRAAQVVRESVPSSISFKPSSQIQGSVTRQILIGIEENWDNAAKKRFKVLAIREALGEISAEEQIELEALNRLRTRKESAVDPEQTLKEYRQRMLARQLMTILEKYVEFYGPPESVSHSARGKA